MFKTTIRVQGFFDDEPKSKTLYFNLSRRELFRLSEEYGGVENFQEYLQDLQNKEDNLGLVEFIDNMIGSAYGERQGERFVKSKDITESFLDGPEYEVIFDKLLKEPDFAMEMMTGLMPAKLMEQVRKDDRYKELEEKVHESN